MPISLISGIGDACGSDPDLERRCDLGLYCSFEKGGTCQLQDFEGQKCSPFEVGSQCDSGACVDVSFGPPSDVPGPPSDNSVCALSQQDGGLCMSEQQCAGYLIGDSVCNIPKDNIGRCTPIYMLLTTVNVSCDISEDMCDARRGLSCRWVGGGLRFACTQRASDGDIGITSRFCTPGLDDDRIST